MKGLPLALLLIALTLQCATVIHAMGGGGGRTSSGGGSRSSSSSGGIKSSPSFGGSSGTSFGGSSGSSIGGSKSPSGFGSSSHTSSLWSSLANLPAINRPSTGGTPTSPLITRPQISPPSNGIAGPAKQQESFLPFINLRRRTGTRPNAHRTSTTTTTSTTETILGSFVRDDRCNKEKITVLFCNKVEIPSYYYDRRRNSCLPYTSCGVQLRENSFPNINTCSSFCIGN